MRGLVINRFDATGIFIAGPGGNIIEGNFIGTDVTGAVIRSNNGGGVVILESPNNRIGGATPGARNIISGNQGGNVQIAGNGASANTVLGNYIGANASGVAAVTADASSGIIIVEAPNNTIGGTTTAARNLISGNFDGVMISGAAATGNINSGQLHRDGRQRHSATAQHRSWHSYSGHPEHPNWWNRRRREQHHCL